MKQGLLLTVAVVLLLAGAVTPWWTTPTPTETDGTWRGSLTLVTYGPCVQDVYGDRACEFFDDASTIDHARRWTFLVGLAAAALLVSAHAAPGGTLARRGLGVAAIVGSAFALVAGLSMICVLIWIAVEAHQGVPGIGGLLFIAGAILGLRSSRVIAAGDPST